MLITKSCGPVSALLLPSFCVPFVNVDFPVFSWGKKKSFSPSAWGHSSLSCFAAQTPPFSWPSFEIVVPQICVPGPLFSCERILACVPLSDGLNFPFYTHSTTSGSLGPTPRPSLISLFHVAY